LFILREPFLIVVKPILQQPLLGIFLAKLVHQSLFVAVLLVVPVPQLLTQLADHFISLLQLELKTFHE
jgi:hypothetical protein